MNKIEEHKEQKMKTDKKLSNTGICALFFILVAISAQGISSNVADNSVVSNSFGNSGSGGMQNATLNLTGLKCLSWSPCINGTQTRDCRLGVKDMSDRRQCNITQAVTQSVPQSVPQGSDYANKSAANNSESNSGNSESDNVVLTEDGSFWTRLFGWLWGK